MRVYRMLSEKQKILFIETNLLAIVGGLNGRTIQWLDRLVASLVWSGQPEEVRRATVRYIVQTSRVAY